MNSGSFHQKSLRKYFFFDSSFHFHFHFAVDQNRCINYSDQLAKCSLKSEHNFWYKFYEVTKMHKTTKHHILKYRNCMIIANFVFCSNIQCQVKASIHTFATGTLQEWVKGFPFCCVTLHAAFVEWTEGDNASFRWLTHWSQSLHNVFIANDCYAIYREFVTDCAYRPVPTTTAASLAHS